MKPSHQDLWSDAIRLHDRRVFLSVLALGVAPDTAREVTQSTWTKLMGKHADGTLAGLQLPGLAIKQARFLALNDIKQTQTQQRALAAVPDRAPETDVQNIVESRQIDMDVKGKDIHSVMQLLAQVGEVNIVIPDHIEATVTVRFKDAPWKHALEAVLASKELWYRYDPETRVVRIDTQKELDWEAEAEIERLRIQQGE